MRRALQLAARGQGSVEPNPMVGCVIVRGGKVVGKGYHRRFGGAHAEVEALRDCRGRPRGATVYVTLEPCCFHGKTPPCTDALLAAGVKRVVTAMGDPHPRVSARGIRTLRGAGIQVDVGVLAGEAARLNAPYLKLVRQKLPWVILKWAQSLDGKLATHTGDARWVTDEQMRAHANRRRGRLDAIIVGSETVRRDDPLLTCRVGRPRRRATRIVLDTDLTTPPSRRVVKTAAEVPTWFFCSTRAPRGRADALGKAGCLVHRVPVDRTGAVDGVSLRAVLDVLGEHQMTNVLVEGGGRVLGGFFDQRLADEVHIYMAPLLVGGVAAVNALNGRGVRTMAEALRLPAATRPRRLGAGWLIAARLD
ncbi:MAG: bifunctional diaminohydroxyphosphoribosylaminopyrimidine deaminase/5-amino-6-(5-phosphoribosylamino)uracil reductase RibD [Planctomycetes bacterium]|nr:bifunctional diaminohydroxyphosphoribosylaminopyrimidine deaminase/5-amino-6-(5-phosphoribosylamino)uracil reductase RibD [Planctomycetota bacterium]